MKKVVEEIVSLIELGKLEIDGVTITNPYEIEIGADSNGFEGEIKLSIKYTGDVIELSNYLVAASKQ